MISHTYLILSLCLWFAVASATVNLAQIVASNENLQEQSTNADKDVNNVNLLNALDNAPIITSDLAGINSALTSVIANAQQVDPTGDGGVQSSVTSSFSSFSNAFTKVMNDLISKHDILTTFGQKSSIYTNLSNLENNYYAYALTLENITLTQADKENIDDAMGGTLGQIGSAVSAYA